MININSIHNMYFQNFIYQIDDNSIDLWLLDPPYEIDCLNHKDYSDKKGLIDWSVLEPELFRTLKPTGNLILFHGWSNDGIKNYFSKWILNNRIIWDRQKYRGSKTNLSNSAEDILWFSKTKERTFNKIESNIRKVTKGFGEKNGREFRVLSNVWSDIPPIFPGKAEHLRGSKYKGQKPVALIKRIITVFSNEGDLIGDGFCGSGTTGEATIELNRNYILCDKSWKAINITSKRLSKLAVTN